MDINGSRITDCHAMKTLTHIKVVLNRTRKPWKLWRNCDVYMCGPVDIRMCVSLYSGVCNTCLSSQSCVSNCFRASWCLLLFCSVRRSVMSELRWSAAERESEDEEMWSIGISSDRLKIPTWCTGKPADVFNILRLLQPAGLETQAPWQTEVTWVKCVFRLNGGDCPPAGCAVFCPGALCSQ